MIVCRCLLANSVTHFAHSAFVLTKTVTTLSYHRSSFAMLYLEPDIVKLAVPHVPFGAIWCLTGQSSLLKLRNGFQSCHVLWEINTPISDLLKFGLPYIKENGTSLNYGLEDKICTANYVNLNLSLQLAK